VTTVRNSIIVGNNLQGSRFRFVYDAIASVACRPLTLLPTAALRGFAHLPVGSAHYII
jgi:hypothetical protein